MPIKIKLAGLTSDGKHLEITDNDFKGDLNLELLCSYFYAKGVPIQYLKFIINGKQLTETNIIYTINENEMQIVYVFAADKFVREKLIQVFLDFGQEIVQSPEPKVICIDDTTEEEDNEDEDKELSEPLIEDKMTLEVSKKINTTALELLKNDDFRRLIEIYKRSPEIFGIFGMYIQQGNIILQDDNKDISEDTIEYYKILVNEIKNLELNYSDEHILNTIIKNYGNVNLTLRELLF